MSENLKLWNSVETTDPNYTKTVDIGHGFTAICAQYQRKNATETFGPFGKGWGVRSPEYQFIELSECKLLTYQAVFWYVLDGNEHEFPICSSMKAEYTSNRGKLVVDEDCFKKVATSALTKGLSFLGFNADVFVGLFDDNQYVSTMLDLAAISEMREQIDTDQIALIEDLLEQTGDREKFLEKIAKVSDVADIPRSRFPTCVSALRQKLSQAVNGSKQK